MLIISTASIIRLLPFIIPSPIIPRIPIRPSPIRLILITRIRTPRSLIRCTRMR